MRMGSCKVFYDKRDASVRVAFAQYRIHGAAQHFCVAVLNLTFGIRLRLLGIVRQVVALCLQLRDCSVKLWNRRRNIRQLDDVGIRRFRQLTEFRQRVTLLLLCRKAIRKRCDNTGRQRYVARLHIDTRRVCECFNDRQKGVCRERGRLVGNRVNDLG